MARLGMGLAVVLAVAATTGANATPGVFAGSACSVATALPAPPTNRPRYVLRMSIDRSLTNVEGTTVVSFAPPVGVTRLVFRLWPNSPFYVAHGTRMQVSKVTIAGRQAPTSRPDPTTLVVRRPVAAGRPVTVSMAWTLRLPHAGGTQLHGGHTARLVSFFPILAWNGTAWATDPPVRRADSFWPTSPVADFDVSIMAPSGLQVLASGESRGTHRWVARAVRDFGVAIGPFDVRRTTVAAPRPVAVTVGVERGSFASARDFVAQAQRVLRIYAARFGDYPWSTYSIAVMRDFPGVNGLASPTLTFLGDASLVLVPHETAHQWFYSLVGNDQWRDPWLSEGLATWAQTGPEGSLGAMLSTTIPPRLRNRIGEPMGFWDAYDFPTIRAGLYTQSVQALAELGDAAAVDCGLRLYVVRNAYRTALPRDLLASLVGLFPDAEAKLRARGAHF
jgi:Peptidase family M1 domain